MGISAAQSTKLDLIEVRVGPRCSQSGRLSHRLILSLDDNDEQFRNNCPQGTDHRKNKTGTHVSETTNALHTEIYCRSPKWRPPKTVETKKKITRNKNVSHLVKTRRHGNHHHTDGRLIDRNWPGGSSLVVRCEKLAAHFRLFSCGHKG